MTESFKVVGKAYKYWVNSNGDLHRLDGPAAEWANGTKEWFLNGVLHRVDGPAIEYLDGQKDWFINGEEFSSQEAWFKALPKECQIDYLFKME